MFTVETASIVETVLRWRLATRVAFRFCFAYFLLYIVSTQMLPGLIPLPFMRTLGFLPPLRTMVEWTGAHVFGVKMPLVIFSGSGDKPFDWVLVFCLLVVSATVTTVWSVMDRRRPQYIRLHKWFHLFMRFALGSTLASYGLAKVVPLQMPAPGLLRLLEPFGHFSPMGVLWASIGASTSYQILTGCAELTAAVLLFIPRTATLGALTALAVTIQIFTLNMTYDVPVKLFSFQLLLMSLFLLAPEARRLMNVLVLNRAAGPSTLPPIGGSVRAIRIGVAAQLIFGAILVGVNVQQVAAGWTQRGGAAALSPLYGVWDIAHLTIDGVERAPLITDYDRWKRVVFDRPTAAAFQRMDDTFVRYTARIEMAAKALTLTGAGAPGQPQGQNRPPAGKFTFERPAHDRLILKGDLAGRKMEMRLELFDRNRFLLVTRGFNWVQDYPFNR